MPYLNQKGKIVIFFVDIQVCIHIGEGRQQSNELQKKKVQFMFAVHKSPTLLCLSGKNENKWKVNGNFACAESVKNKLSVSAFEWREEED